MSSPTQGMWTCRHGVDGRDWCEECHAPARRFLFEDLYDDDRAVVLATLALAVAQCRKVQHEAEDTLEKLTWPAKDALANAPALTEQAYQDSLTYRALADELADLKLEP